MAVTATFCCVFFISILIARLAQGEDKFAPYVISRDGSGRCPSQLEIEGVRQNIDNYIKNNIVGLPVPNCGSGLWYRVAYLNMSDLSQQCPSTWRGTCGLGACRRQYGVSCSSVHYTSNGFRYRKVCGQVIGYQLGSTDVFDNLNRSIDSAYVDGVSITHGTPRTHIWTYAAGEHDSLVSVWDCPCLVNGSRFTPQTPPSYVGDNYYCESGNNNTSGYPSSIADTNDLLWDGQQCEGQCCSNGKTPPWFSVDLPNPTSDDIEVRLCDMDYGYGGDTPIKLLEIYIQV